ncbi:uncharacterized protein Dwil_GK27231 [Drosophila willistoni]|uniref:Uncharacterized protein n=1 Tax=Drosophila willistoni TaxID=7260 RepID=A0A0Q9WNH1_DROWI|nr:uncharacterized protein LOC26529233 [Drosophila willistoni]KRF97466.1 uncharacterized protein Dwil_GK27231 [Drosophila willistoni]
MQFSKTAIALLLGCIVLLGPMMDVVHSFELSKAAACAEVAAGAGAAGLSGAVPIVKALITCSEYKATKTNVQDPTDLFLLIGNFVQKVMRKPSCVSDAVLSAQKVLASHVDKLFAAKCFN